MNPMRPDETELRNLTRRHFFAESSLGIGSVALASLLSGNQLLAAPTTAANARQTNPLAPALPHFAAKAKRVIFLFMAGGPSQLELFEPKPKLQELDGQVIPESFVAGKRFAFIKPDAKLLGTRRKFARYGESGAIISDCLPYLTTVADDVCFVKSMTTDVFNHGP